MSGDVILPGTKSSPHEAKYADRLDTLEGAKLAFVDWGKPNGDVLYEHFRDLFTEEFGIGSLDYYKKPSPSSPIPREIREEILESGAEGVIFAIADCGSCNSSVVIDAVTFEELNIPSVQIITNRFLDLNNTISEGRGYDKLPLIALDHPTRYLDEDEVFEIARDIMWTVNTSLTCEECLLGPRHQ